jgi:hypothetical protein
LLLLRFRPMATHKLLPLQQQQQQQQQLLLVVLQVQLCC